VPERLRTAFADILRNEPDPVVGDRDTRDVEAVSTAVVHTSAFSKPVPAKRNKATSPEYTKLTAYIPRKLAAAIKMSMALDQTADQSEYIENALTEWLKSKGRETILSQAVQAESARL